MTSPPKKKATATRIRRTAPEAREAILDAAEARLREGGPEAIRLQDIARDVGISHPTILHHFESRDGLTRALGLRITQRLVAELAEALTHQPANATNAEAIIEHVFATMGDTGTARLVAWRALTFGSAAEAHALLESIANLLHERRVELALRAGKPPPPREDSVFVARLTAAAAVGDALSGQVWTEGSEEPHETDVRFRRWFARLLMRHIDKV